ncbi:fluoride efflux transporter CrcB [Opitutaceae bacterium]
MSLTLLLIVALGGALGSVARVVVSLLIPSTRLPWGTILVNVAGSLLIGYLMGRLGGLNPENARWHGLLVAGFCGGFTTFSTFSWQTVDAFQRGQPWSAAANVLVSVAACLVATWLGWRIAR